MAQTAASTTETTVQTAMQAMLVGTPVLTLEGELPVEFLAPGDRILTRGGARRVPLSTVHVLVADPARVALFRLVAASRLHLRRRSGSSQDIAGA